MDYHAAAEHRAREAAKALANAVNEMGFDCKAFAAELSHQHRTLQQNAFRALVAVVQEFAAMHDAGNYDLRNEGACKVAKTMTQAMGDRTYLPMV